MVHEKALHVLRGAQLLFFFWLGKSVWDFLSSQCVPIAPHFITYVLPKVELSYIYIYNKLYRDQKGRPFMILLGEGSMFLIYYLRGTPKVYMCILYIYKHRALPIRSAKVLLFRPPQSIVYIYIYMKVQLWA